MKLSDLTPCACCHQPLAPHFYIVRVSQAMVMPQATREVMGTAMILGGLENPGALRIAEVMAPNAENAVMVFGDEDSALMTELIICQQCVLTGNTDLAIAMTENNDGHNPGQGASGEDRVRRSAEQQAGTTPGGVGASLRRDGRGEVPGADASGSVVPDRHRDHVPTADRTCGQGVSTLEQRIGQAQRTAVRP